MTSEVRRKLVDARYLEASIPATHEPSFDVAPGARVVPVNDLPAAARPRTRYTVLGSGKTAVDACTWLLDNDVAPDRIRWVRPREPGFTTGATSSRWTLVGEIMDGISLDAEAGAEAADIDDLFDRLRSIGTPGPHRPVGSRDDVPHHDAQSQRDRCRCGRSRTWSGSAACAGSRRDRIVLEQGETDTRPRRPARRLHGARPAQRTRDPHLSATAASCSSRSGRTRRRSTRRSSPSSRPTATTTPTRTGSARPIPTRAASTIGPA